MAQSQRETELRFASESLASQDILVEETETRKLSENGNGTRQSSLSKAFCTHLGVKTGEELQMSLHPGGQPVPISGPCIIIRPSGQKHD